MKRNYLYCCLSVAVLSLSLSATAQNTDTARASLAKIKPITIMGNRINQIDNTLPNVDIIHLNELLKPGVSDLRDAIRKNPALELNTSGSGQAQQLRIRGFGENYTELTLDGIKMPSYFVFGPYTAGQRDFVETDTIKQLDVIKGLHSPKQSAGALAGTVNMQTYVPGDFVDESSPFYFSVKPSYTSKNDGIGATLTLAGKKEDLAGMLIYTQRRYHELDYVGDNDSLRDKQDIDQYNVLGKLALDLDKGNLLFSAEYFDRDIKTHGKRTTYTDPSKRTRLSAEANLFDVWGLDKVYMQTSYQKYKQKFVEYYPMPGSLHGHEQDYINARFDGEKRLDFAGMQHHWLFGLAYNQHNYDYKIDTPKGINRYMPEIKRDNYTLYLKDKLVFANGLSIAPGIRVEHQRVSSKTDDAYFKNPAVVIQEGYAPKGHSTMVSPSINASLPIGENIELFASYAHGVKAADEANLGSFDHGFGWIIPNPDLKSEKSNNYELGLSYIVPEQLEFKMTGFYTRFRDFIDFSHDGFLGKTPDGRPKMVLRPFNVNKAKTYGVEIESGYALNEQLYAHAAFAWMRGRMGEENSHGVSLSQAYPYKAFLGLSYKQGEQWGADLDWTLVGKGKKPDDPVKQFRTPGYGVVDLTGWWRPTDHFTVTAGVYNLTDKKYWLSSDANGMRQVDQKGEPYNMDIYTQPGRNFAINFRYEF